MAKESPRRSEMQGIWCNIHHICQPLQTRLDVEDGTLTGLIQFDKFGFRKNFDVTVIDLVSSEKSAFNQKEVALRFKKI
jgi:hypothetical protein